MRVMKNNEMSLCFSFRVSLKVKNVKTWKNPVIPVKKR